MKVICYGDSNTYGYDPRSFWGGRYESSSRWVDILEEKTGWEIVNQGENGREIPENPVNFPADTDLLILMLGTNDLLQGCSPESAAKKLERFVSGINLGTERILLLAPPTMAIGEWVPNGTLMQASVEYAEYCHALSKRLSIRFFDAGCWNISMAYDGVHFTEAGHRAFATELLSRLENGKMFK